jgi:crotonobetainyl-CoA:carnitine CoA-transferase CaiB-like acyl-CoA transferase
MADWLGYFPHLWWHRGELPERTGARHPLFCPYGPFPCADGLVSLAVLSPAHWRALCLDVLDRPDLLANERLATNEGRVAHRAELEPELEAELAARTAEEWIAALEAAGIPCGRVLDVAGVLAHPAFEHGKLGAEVGSPAGPLPTVGVPFLLAGSRPQPGDVPALGEHTDEVLRELGL